MDQLPKLLDPNLDVEAVFGDLLEFELHVKPEHIPQPGDIIAWSTWKQNSARLRYCCEFKRIPCREWRDEEGYHFVASKPKQIPKTKEVEFEEVQHALPKPEEPSSNSESDSTCEAEGELGRERNSN